MNYTNRQGNYTKVIKGARFNSDVETAIENTKVDECNYYI